MKEIALIGINGFGRHHHVQLLRLHRAGLARYTAAVVRSPGKCPQELEELKRIGTVIYSSPEELFSDRSRHYDFISLPTGIPSHEPLLKKGLEYGADMLLEKPLTATVESARRMIAAVDNAPGRLVAVGFQNLSGDEVREVKRRILDGAIGRLRKITVTGLWPRNDAYYYRNNWAARMKCGDDYVLDSPVNNAFAHFLNVALFFAAEQFWDIAKIRGVQAELYRARPEIETFDCCSLRFLTENDIELILNFAHATETEVEPMIRIDGTNGSVEWQLRNFCRIRSGETVSEIPTGDPVTRQFDRLAARLNGQEELFCTVRMASRHVFCVNAIHMTARPVVLPPEAYQVKPDGLHAIDGLGELFARCYEKGCLLSELGDVPWSASTPFQVCEHIDRFQPIF